MGNYDQLTIQLLTCMGILWSIIVCFRLFDFFLHWLWNEFSIFRLTYAHLMTFSWASDQYLLRVEKPEISTESLHWQDLNSQPPALWCWPTASNSLLCLLQAYGTWCLCKTLIDFLHSNLLWPLHSFLMSFYIVFPSTYTKFYIIWQSQPSVCY